MAVVGMSWDTAILQSDTEEKQLMGVGWEHREVQCEGDVSGRCFGRNGGLGAALLVSVVDGSYRSWFVALQRRDRGGKGGEGKADEVSLHTEVCCPLCSLQHMAKALELTKKKKEKEKDIHWKNRLEKYLTLCLEAGFSDWMCVTPPLTGDTVKCQPI